jgi:hypothetical protein
MRMPMLELLGHAFGGAHAATGGLDRQDRRAQDARQFRDELANVFSSRGWLPGSV